MIEMKTLKETIITYVPLFNPYYGYADHRKACSIIFDKEMDVSLIILAKHMHQKGVVLHTFEFDTENWSRLVTNIDYFGMVK